MNAKRFSDGDRSGLFRDIVAGEGARPGIAEAAGSRPKKWRPAFSVCRSRAPEAVRLRRWDEGAKVPAGRPPDLAHFRRYLEASLTVC